MIQDKKDKAMFLIFGAIIGLILGALLVGVGGIVVYKAIKGGKHDSRHGLEEEAATAFNTPKKNDMRGTEKVNIPETLSDGFKILVVSSLDRVFMDGKVLRKPAISKAAVISVAKNEYESLQVVIVNGKDVLKSVQLGISDLVNTETEEKIDSKNISWRAVGYVPTKKPYYSVKFVGPWPDPLLPSDSVDIAPGVTQPFWITMYTPGDTPAGVYSGSIGIKAENNPVIHIPFYVKVFNFTLPRKNSLKTAFDFYPDITASRYPQKENEGESAYDARIAWLNEQYIIDMLKHKIDPILNIDPTSENDLRRVDKYRLYGLENFSVGKHGGTFGNNWPKSDEEIEKLLPLYRLYGENLKINRMMDYQYIYTWDEGEIGNPLVAKITSMIHRAHPELRNMVCYHGFWDPDKDPEWGKDIDIWCFGIGDFDEEKVKKLESLGMEMWMYVSGPSSAGEPNLAIDFDSIDYRIIPWLCWKYDIKGFLYWCVNWWSHANPFESAANTEWEQNGNGLLYYPGEDGPISSLRLKIFRDGMEDYEYLVILRDKLKDLKERGLADNHKDIYEEWLNLLDIDSSLASSAKNFTKDGQDLFQRRYRIAEAIESIDKLLLKKNGTESAKPSRQGIASML